MASEAISALKSNQVFDFMRVQRDDNLKSFLEKQAKGLLCHGVRTEPTKRLTCFFRFRIERAGRTAAVLCRGHQDQS
jgi:hypothetical protein